MGFRALLAHLKPRSTEPEPAAPVHTDDIVNAAGKTREIMKTLNQLLVVNGREDLGYDKMIDDYLGHSERHPSLHRGDQKMEAPTSESMRTFTPQSLPAYARMLGDMHKVLRSDMIKHLDIKLDEEALPAETRASIQALTENQRKYQDIMTAYINASKAAHNGAPPSITVENACHVPGIDPLIEDAVTITDALSDSILSRKNATIPLLVKGEKMQVSNANGIAGVVLALNLGSIHMVDATKVPQPTGAYYMHCLGDTAIAIPRKIEETCATSPQLKRRYDEAVAECLPDLINAIKGGSHTLQVLNLLTSRTSLGNRPQSGAQLLAIAGLPQTPDHLDSKGIEFALMVDTLNRTLPASARRDLETVKAYRPDSQEPTAQLAALDKLKKTYPDYEKQFTLMRGYMQSPQQFAGNVKRGDNHQAL